MIDTLALPFDQYQRYRLVADLLEELRPKGGRWKVLDVGGRTALLRAFLPDDEIVLVDLEPSGERGLVLGDGSRLPFQDASVDVVAAFDTLEHVPPAARARFVDECRRVARRYVILAGPYQTAEVEEAEQILQQFLQAKLKVEHRYLEEHRHNGLPVQKDVELQLERAGARVVSIGHGNLDRWLALICMSMYMDYVPELRGIAQRFFRFYNKNLHASDATPPVYRHAVVAALAGAPLPAARTLPLPEARTLERKDGGGKTPAGALQRVTELAFELVAFDRERAEWQDKWRRLQEVNKDLAQDLEGHRGTLDEARRIGAEQAEVIETLEQDLKGHRLVKLRLEGELEALRTAAEEMRVAARAELEATRTEHGIAIGEHKAVITTLETDLEGHRLVVDALRRELEVHKDVVAVQSGEIAQAFAENARVAELLRQNDALIGVLRRELASRWRSLKRALGPKRPPP